MKVPPSLELILKQIHRGLLIFGDVLYSLTLDHIGHFKKWATIEKNLSPDERNIKTNFFLSIFFIGVVLFIASSASAYLEQTDYEFWPVAEVETGVSDSFLLADEGFFGKTSIPTIGDIDRSESATVISYTSQPGDTLSDIAARYGVRVLTILENNDIENTNTLETGTTIKILPVDGFIHSIESGETLSQIANEYNVDQAVLEKQNRLEANQDLISGKNLIIPGKTRAEFIPEATPIPEVVVATNNTSNTTSTNNTNTANTPTTTKRPTATKKPIPTKVPVKNVKVSTASVAKPVTGKKYVWPVVGGGTFTQGYRYGHYGIDLADPSRPGILAIASGTVIQAAGGCGNRSTGCNGGYGNVVVIDHGNGVKARYAHNTINYVGVGERVVAGQLIAKMGNSGNVRGVTGIHLHFEMMINGSKKNPLNYL